MDARAKTFGRNLVIGGAAAAVSKTAVAPIERVKILLQVQHSHANIAAAQRYTGIVDAFIRVPKEQGVLSLWRGNATNVLRYLPTQALNFAFNDFYKDAFLRGVDKRNQFWLYTSGVLICGGLAACSSLCVMYPLDVTRMKLAADVGRAPESRQYTGLVDCVRKTLKCEGGVAGLYRGFFVAAQAYFIYRSIYFGLNDLIRAQTHADPRRVHFVHAFAIAQCVNIVSSYIVYPLDTVRNRMIIKGEYSSSMAWQSARRILDVEGFRGLYKGALANMFRTSGGALVMALYHEIQKHV